MNFKTLEVPIEDKSTDFNKIVADSDSMETPPALFKAISEHFGGFNLDVAATEDNTRCDNYVSSENSGCDIHLKWRPFPDSKGRVWCNPPYSNPEPWLRKAYNEVRFQGNCELAVILLKFDCTTKLFRQYSLLADEIVLLTGRRIRFIGRFMKPDGTLSLNTQSRDSHCLFVFRA